jgi:antitoxin CptB
MQDIELYKKKLSYKANNRGWKETDILLGKFAQTHLDSLNYDELKMFDLILDETDKNIFDWITNKNSPPIQHQNKVMNMLRIKSE